jgi:hypothetical protein
MKLLKRTTALLAVTLVLGTAGCNRGPSDAAITGRVKTAISNEAGLKETKVSVATNEKVVHLSGTVKSRDERAMLIATARKVDGVKAVKTDLAVAPPQDAAVKRQPKPQQKRTVQARAKQEPRAQIRTTPPGPGVPPER